MRIRDQSELKFGLNAAERLFFRGPWIFCVSESGKYDFLGEMFHQVGDSWVSKLQALFFFLYFWAIPTVISKILLSRGTNRQNKHKKTKLNNMAVILRVFI